MGSSAPKMEEAGLQTAERRRTKTVERLARLCRALAGKPGRSGDLHMFGTANSGAGASPGDGSAAVSKYSLSTVVPHRRR